MSVFNQSGDTYFAQARRYDASIGRFVSEDAVRGAKVIPIFMNQYIYCQNRPNDFLDLDGNRSVEGIYATGNSSVGKCPIDNLVENCQNRTVTFGDIFNAGKYVGNLTKTWNGITDFYNKHEKEIKKVALTALVVTAGIAFCALTGGAGAAAVVVLVQHVVRLEEVLQVMQLEAMS